MIRELSGNEAASFTRKSTKDEKRLLREKFEKIFSI